MDEPDWIPYQDTSGASPILAYAIGDGFIDLLFEAHGRAPKRGYRYNGAELVSLIELATTGQGLATYIARNRPTFSHRWAE